MNARVSVSPTREEFASQLDGSFRAKGPEGEEFDLTLVEYHDEFESDTQETFSLIFKAPADAPVLQSIYEVRNAAIGEQDMFLVPIKQDADGLYYQAVYNRFKK